MVLSDEQRKAMFANIGKGKTKTKKTSLKRPTIKKKNKNSTMVKGGSIKTKSPGEMKRTPIKGTKLKHLQKNPTSGRYTQKIGGREAIRYDTKRDYTLDELKKQRDDMEKSANKGELICISDLIGTHEHKHITSQSKAKPLKKHRATTSTHVTVMGLKLTNDQYIKLLNRTKRIPSWNTLSAAKRKKFIQQEILNRHNTPTLKGTTLWKVQYEPREKFIRKNLTAKALKKWDSSSELKKIRVIDGLERKGFFKKKTP